MVKANVFANTGTLRGIGGRGADDKAESPQAALMRGDYDKLFGF
jgi:hypothetical protein